MARYEEKFLVPLDQLEQIRSIFDSDKFNFQKCYPDRSVNSIYFDTDDLYFAAQNIYGNGLRAKIRLRFYNHNWLKTNLEVKYKNFSVGKKFVVPFELHEELPDAKELWKSLSTLSEAPLNHYMYIKPTVYVNYTRSYWTSNTFHGIRVTLDSRIHAKEVFKKSIVSQLFDLCTPVDDLCVLEVKYNRDINASLFKNYLNSFAQLRQSKFSKYILGLVYTSQLRII